MVSLAGSHHSYLAILVKYIRAKKKKKKKKKERSPLLERAPTAFSYNGPSFSRGCVLVTFQKILLPLEKQALCVSDFRLELREKTTNSRFHNFDFQELSNKLSFRTEQSMSTTKPLRKLAIILFRFFEEKSAFLNSRLAAFTFA